MDRPASGLTSGLDVAIANSVRSSLHFLSAGRTCGRLALFRRGRRQSTCRTPNRLCSRTMTPPVRWCEVFLLRF